MKIKVSRRSIELLQMAAREFMAGQRELADGNFEIDVDDEVYKRMMKVGRTHDEAIEILCTHKHGKH